ncbi:ABC transporter permease [Gynuella sp.]|uniref:ABC transporter permease n=1 Tax=Gynuella sp. TaxID=2969146 RepID=UPI003D127B11
MTNFIIRRMMAMLITMLVLSLVSFIIIQLPPGDYLSAYIAKLRATGDTVSDDMIEALRVQYGLDQPFYIQYWKWISNIVLHGDFGRSFEWKQPVSELVWGRIGLSMMVEGMTVIFIWAIAVPVGIYSAVRRYSIGDHVGTVFCFIGVATPNFMLALILMYFAYLWSGTSIAGLFSDQYANAEWSMARFMDFLKHAWAPVIVLGTAGTAQIMRVMRANLLDEINKPYVVTARSKGLAEHQLILKYPVRVALNPLVSTLGWILPTLVSGSVIVGVVMSLPTAGPMLLRSLTSQDMYLAGAFVLLLGVLTLIGTLISDLILAWLDPRIRLS